MYHYNNKIYVIAEVIVHPKYAIITNTDSIK